MSAELTLFLIEEGYPLEKAKAVAAAAPSTVADLALALLEALPGALTVAEARAQAERAPLAPAKGGRSWSEVKTGPNTRVQHASDEDFDDEGNPQPLRPVYTPVLGADGLTDRQRAAVATVGLCPNCQQPKNDHLPGCARIDATFDNRSVTKDRLPPAV